MTHTSPTRAKDMAVIYTADDHLVPFSITGKIEMKVMLVLGMRTLALWTVCA